MGFIAQENVVTDGRFWPKGATIPDDVAATLTPGSSVFGDQEAPDTPAAEEVEEATPVSSDGEGLETPGPSDDPASEQESSTVPTELNRITEIMEWVGKDAERAATALQQEKADTKPRTMLVDGLEEVIRAAAKNADGD